MTFMYYRNVPEAQRGLGCPHHSGTFLQFLAHWTDRGSNILTPVSGRASAAPRKPSATYILQKDPDGSWFIDQCKPDTAAAIRPISTPAPDDGRYCAPACDNADAFFIIEFG